MSQNYLQPGERKLAVTVSNPRGTFRSGMSRGMVGVKLTARGAAARAAGEHLAASLPSESLWLVLTDRRLLAIGTAGTLKLGDLKTEFEPADIAGIEATKRIMTWVCDLVFADGSVQQLEMQKTAKPEPFCSALNAWAAGGAAT